MSDTQRCDDCKRFTTHRTNVVLMPRIGSSIDLCDRCLRLFDLGDDQCWECVVDRHGDEAPCNRRAFDVRLDVRDGRPYPVCRKHYRPPFAAANSSSNTPTCSTVSGQRESA